MPKIRNMTDNDIDFANELTNFEKWANSKADFRRLINLYPKGNFIAHENEKKVGIITTAVFGKLAFIGNLIVPVKYRGRGIGRGLMEHALNYLTQQKSIKTIELDGDFPAVELYRKLGFKDKYFSLRFCRRPADSFNGDITPGAIEPAKMAELDKKLFDKPNLTRDIFIKEFATLHNGKIFVFDNKSDKGYSIIRKCFGGYYVIGPTMANNPKVADSLIKSVVNSYESEVIYAGVPEINRSAVKIMLSNGFFYEQPSLRMYLGKKLNYEKNIYSIISGDIG